LRYHYFDILNNGWDLEPTISGDTVVGKSWDGLLVFSRVVVDILVMLLYNIPDLYYTIYSLFNDDAFDYR
jgi:hypothetical protein